MTTLNDILNWVTTRSGHGLKPDEGVQLGDAEQPVRKVWFCWAPDEAALKAAADWGADFVIAHESLAAPYNAMVRPELDESWRHWPYNRRRLEWLEKQGMGFCRLHYIADALTILDDVAARLELGGAVVDEPDLVKVYAPSPATIGSWIARAKTVFGLPHLRVAFAPGSTGGTIVHRIGLPWGGMGLFVNVAYQQALAAHGCDLFIAGETDNFAMRFAVEQNISVIETSHDVNEVPGFARFAEDILRAHPDLEGHIWRQECVWKMQ